MSTYLSLNYHIIFATKNRLTTIEYTWKGQLHAYLGGIARGQGGVALAVNGIDDHVHMLVGLKATHCRATGEEIIVSVGAPGASPSGIRVARRICGISR